MSKKFDADKALKKARESVHGFFGDRTSPFCDPPTDVIPDSAFVRLLNVKEEEVEELLNNNVYDDIQLNIDRYFKISSRKTIMKDLDKIGISYFIPCPHCKKGELSLVSADNPFNSRHYQCDKCDSTYTEEEILYG